MNFFSFKTVFYYITLQLRGNNTEVINKVSKYIIAMRNALMQSKQKRKSCNFKVTCNQKIKNIYYELCVFMHMDTCGPLYSAV